MFKLITLGKLSYGRKLGPEVTSRMVACAFSCWQLLEVSVAGDLRIEQELRCSKCLIHYKINSEGY